MEYRKLATLNRVGLSFDAIPVEGGGRAYLHSATLEIPRFAYLHLGKDAPKVKRKRQYLIFREDNRWKICQFYDGILEDISITDQKHLTLKEAAHTLKRYLDKVEAGEIDRSFWD